MTNESSISTSVVLLVQLIVNPLVVIPEKLVNVGAEDAERIVVVEAGSEIELPPLLV